MAYLNKSQLIGNVGADPEVRYMPNGNAVASLSLATTKAFKDKDGNKQHRTEWHRVVFFNKLAEIVGEYVKKGSPLYVEGELRTRKWQDKDGKDHYTTEIIGGEMQMLGTKPEGQSHTATQVPPPAPATEQNNWDEYDQDIPF